MDLVRVLNSVGKSTFVKYYYNFKNKSREECIMLFEEVFTDKAKATRTGHAQRIFRENKHIEALALVAKSNRVDCVTRKKAEELLEIESR